MFAETDFKVSNISSKLCFIAWKSGFFLLFDLYIFVFAFKTNWVGYSSTILKPGYLNKRYELN